MLISHPAAFGVSCLPLCILKIPFAYNFNLYELGTCERNRSDRLSLVAVRWGTRRPTLIDVCVDYSGSCQVDTPRADRHLTNGGRRPNAGEDGLGGLVRLTTSFAPAEPAEPRAVDSYKRDTVDGVTTLVGAAPPVTPPEEVGAIIRALRGEGRL